MLGDAFEANGDMAGAYQFWKSRISRGKMTSADLGLFEKMTENLNDVDFSSRDLIKICTAALQRDPSEDAARILVKASRYLRNVEARITQLKSVLYTLKLNYGELEDTDLGEVEDASEVPVEELAQTIMEGDEKYVW